MSRKDDRHVAMKIERGRGHLSLNPSPPLRGGEGAISGVECVHLAEAKVLMKSAKTNLHIAAIVRGDAAHLSLGPSPPLRSGDGRCRALSVFTLLKPRC